MCGVAGVYSFGHKKIEGLHSHLTLMSNLIAHRGPDDSGIWINSSSTLGLGHRRLSIVDLSNHAHQPKMETS